MDTCVVIKDVGSDFRTTKSIILSSLWNMKKMKNVKLCSAQLFNASWGNSES